MTHPHPYLLDRCKDTHLYGIIERGGAVLYEATFTRPEARRLLTCVLANPALTWEACADYVEGRTTVPPFSHAKKEQPGGYKKGKNYT
jgi:hypothetical protein